jgi:succinate dehydrogenase/fumarate reductase flavoprotein subunit
MMPAPCTAFDESTDVIVVGYGFAGGAAAIAAADAGCDVLLLEKMAVPGGISICSGGGLRVANDPAKALAYLTATNDGTIEAPLLERFATEMTEIHGRFEKLAQTSHAILKLVERPANYALPGWDTFNFLEVDQVPGFDARTEFPHARSLRAGINAFKVVADNVRARRSIEVRYEAPVIRLQRDGTGRVCGVTASIAGRVRSIGARCGVILACGGFEADAAMQRQYWRMHPVLPAATRGNTGDGIRMAQAVGADLRHMWHFHGSYGFRHPDPAYVFGIRTKKLPDWTPGVLATSVQLSWVLVNRNGRRFMNEYEPYTHDTGQRGFDRFDAVTLRQPCVPAIMLFDETRRTAYPVARSFINDPEIPCYDWSEDNLKEVEIGILKRADTIDDVAKTIGADASVLHATINEWNAACGTDAPDEFGRPAATRAPVIDPPFYFGDVWPVVSNTQGALAHDVEQRVLDPYGLPIDGLYVAGELGSIWGYLYLSGGNLVECFISGRIAAEHAAARAA